MLHDVGRRAEAAASAGCRCRSSEDTDLALRLKPLGHHSQAAQVILISVAVWDAKCPKHIPRRFKAADVGAADAILKTDVDPLKS